MESRQWYLAASLGALLGAVEAAAAPAVGSLDPAQIDTSVREIWVLGSGFGNSRSGRAVVYGTGTKGEPAGFLKALQWSDGKIRAGIPANLGPGSYRVGVKEQGKVYWGRQTLRITPPVSRSAVEDNLVERQPASQKREAERGVTAATPLPRLEIVSARAPARVRIGEDAELSATVRLTGEPDPRRRSRESPNRLNYPIFVTFGAGVWNSESMGDTEREYIGSGVNTTYTDRVSVRLRQVDQGMWRPFVSVRSVPGEWERGAGHDRREWSVPVDGISDVTVSIESLRVRDACDRDGVGEWSLRLEVSCTEDAAARLGIPEYTGFGRGLACPPAAVRWPRRGGVDLRSGQSVAATGPSTSATLLNVPENMSIRVSVQAEEHDSSGTRGAGETSRTYSAEEWRSGRPPPLPPPGPGVCGEDAFTATIRIDPGR